MNLERVSGNTHTRTHTHTQEPKVSDIRSDPYNIHKNLEIIADLYVTREFEIASGTVSLYNTHNGFQEH